MLSALGHSMDGACWHGARLRREEEGAGGAAEAAWVVGKMEEEGARMRCQCTEGAGERGRQQMQLYAFDPRPGLEPEPQQPHPMYLILR